MLGSTLIALLLSAFSVDAVRYPGKRSGIPAAAPKLHSKRQFPAPVYGYTTIVTPSGVTIRYKEPGICETTPGVKSYTGYVDVAPNMHAFFWFFESRSNPRLVAMCCQQEVPQSMAHTNSVGILSIFSSLRSIQYRSGHAVAQWWSWKRFSNWSIPGQSLSSYWKYRQISCSFTNPLQEHGPCNISANLQAMLNPYSWNNASNMIYLSQPYGVGFSYMEEEIGSFNNVSGAFVNASSAPATGRWPVTDPLAIDTTELAAIAAWHIIQGLYSGLPRLASDVKSVEFNLWTESYGGHYGQVSWREVIT